MPMFINFEKIAGNATWNSAEKKGLIWVNVTSDLAMQMIMDLWWARRLLEEAAEQVVHAGKDTQDGGEKEDREHWDSLVVQTDTGGVGVEWSKESQKKHDAIFGGGGGGGGGGVLVRRTRLFKHEGEGVEVDWLKIVTGGRQERKKKRKTQSTAQTTKVEENNVGSGNGGAEEL